MGIVIAAAITTLVALGAAGLIYARLTDASLKRAVLLAALVALPLQPLVFHLVRMPLDGVLLSALGSGNAYVVLTTFYAPLTEEPAKWLVLLVPFVRRALVPHAAVPIALATGAGFGIGEIWFLAEQIARVPDYAAVPFHMFTGFLYERLIVVFLHGAFVMFLFQRLADGRALLPGALIGMALHWLLNLPIFLTALQAFGMPIEKWQLISLLVQILITWALAVVALKLFRKAARERDNSSEA